LITLSLDTTGSWCTAALVDSSRILASYSEKIGRGHAERLAPAVSGILNQASLNPGDINRLAVATGPGSFTGLRVALAFARSFALPRKLPVIGLSVPEVLAAEIDPAYQNRIASVINVRRGDLCLAVFDKGVEIFAPTTLPTAEANAQLKKLGYDRITGDGVSLLDLKSGGPDHVSGPVLAWLSQNYTPDERPPEPLYSRGPDAKLPGGKTPK